LHEGYKIWPWRFDSQGQRLLHLKSDCMDVYEMMKGAVTCSAIRWELAQEGQRREEVGEICSVKEVEHGRCVLLSSKAPSRAREMPETILEVLEEWECMWMWPSLRLLGDEH